MKKRDASTGRRYRDLQNEVSQLVRRDKQESNLLSLKKSSNGPNVLGHLADQVLGPKGPCPHPSPVQTDPLRPPWRRPR
jgi:hypothetical protein